MSKNVSKKNLKKLKLFLESQSKPNSKPDKKPKPGTPPNQ